jgi:hypothetical protein
LSAVLSWYSTSYSGVSCSSNRAAAEEVDMTLSYTLPKPGPGFPSRGAVFCRPKCALNAANAGLLHALSVKHAAPYEHRCFLPT